MDATRRMYFLATFVPLYRVMPHVDSDEPITCKPSASTQWSENQAPPLMYGAAHDGRGKWGPDVVPPQGTLSPCIMDSQVTGSVTYFVVGVH